MPKLSPLSTKPRVNISEIPIGADPCLEWFRGSVPSTLEEVDIVAGGRVLRLRLGATGGGVGTSIGMLSSARFSITIEDPVAALGDI